MLIVLAVVVAVCLIYAADRIVRLRRWAHQRRQMAYRLAAAAARAEVAERKRKAAAAASADLTSVIPAINHPEITYGGVASQAHRARTARSHGPHTGPQRPGSGTGPQRQGTGPQRRGGPAGAHGRPQTGRSTHSPGSGRPQP